jgi:hypothetical protein
MNEMNFPPISNVREWTATCAIRVEHQNAALAWEGFDRNFGRCK